MITTAQIAVVAEKKLIEVKAQFSTMQQHAKLRQLLGAKSFESVHNLQKRYAVQLAKIELMGL